MDMIFVESLQLEAIIGVYDNERHRPQPLTLDLWCGCHTQTAAQSDVIQDAVDYAAIIECVKITVANSTFNLLEALASAIMDALFQKFELTWIKIRLIKPIAIAGVPMVGVVMERHRSPSNTQTAMCKCHTP